MAGKIKGITIEIGGDTQPLNKALADVNKKSKDLQSELRQVEKLLKLDPGNTELLAQKHKLLAEAVSNSKEKLNRLKTAQAEVNEQFKKGEISEEQYRAFQREVVKAEQTLNALTDQQKKANGILTDTEIAAQKAALAMEEKAKADAEAAEKVEKLANRSKDLQNELEEVNRLLEMDPGNIELIAQKQKILAEAVDESKERLNRLKDAQAEVNAQFAKGDLGEEEYRAFQREVAKTEQELKGFERQLNETAKATDTWKNKLDKAQTSLKNVGAKMTDMGKTLSMSVTAPIVAVGTASFKMAADLQDAMGATDQIFAKASDSVKKWADGLDSYYGIAESEALEYANMMGSMLKNIGGLTEEEASKQAATLIELAGDLTAMYGGTTADAVQALTGALKGNNTMLDNYGMAANDAMVKTKALEMGLYDGTGQMDLASKQAATLALIMEQSAAAQGQAAREAEGASGGMRSFATEIKNLSTDIGEVLLPVITPLLANLNDIVKKFGDLSPEMKKAIVIVAGLAAAIGPLLILLGTLSIAIGVISLPVVAVVAAIGLLIAAIVMLYNKWKENGERSKEILEDLYVKVQEVVDGVINFFGNLSSSAKAIWQDMWNSITTYFDGIRTRITTAMTEFTDGMLKKWDNFKGGLISIWAAITGSIKGYINNMIGFVNRLIDALNSIKVEIPDWVPGFGGQKFGIDLPHVPALATGTNYIPRDMLAYLHKGEAVVPAKYNPANTTTTVIKEIHIHGNNADEIWSKFERNLHKLGVVF